jgi:hypothetical protein
MAWVTPRVEIFLIELFYAPKRERKRKHAINDFKPRVLEDIF